MNMGKHGLLFFLLLAAQGGCLHHHNRLSIDVFFEALCPDSYNFIKYQLHPSWRFIKNHVYIRFIPFGKSKSSGNGARFHCQHGPRECEGNKMMSCALNEINDQNEQMKYVNCFMTTFKRARQYKDEFGQKCAYELGISWDSLRNCYNSEDGTNLQLEAEVMTNRIKPSFVPTIVYNDVYDQFLQDTSQTNFRLVVCTLLSENHGVEC